MKQGLSFFQDSDDAGFFVVEVLEENCVSVDVFCCCQPELVAGYGVFLWRGVSATEVKAACDLLGVHEDTDFVLRNVIYMGSVVSSYLNAK